MEHIVTFLQGLSPVLLYATLFGIAFVENIFPPSPSDMVIVFGGSLVGMGLIAFGPALLWSTAGSTLGFMVVYGIGKWFGEHIVEKVRPKFLPIEAIHKVEQWFQRWDYWIIIVNRFLAGTRAVVSFFAGMSELHFVNTSILCAISAGVWNALLLLGGYYLGHNWERIGFYLSTYSEAVTAGVIVFLLVIGGRKLYQSRRKNRRA